MPSEMYIRTELAFGLSVPQPPNLTPLCKSVFSKILLQLFEGGSKQHVYKEPRQQL